MKLKYGRGYTYSLIYHVIWCVKYRKKVLNSEIEQDLRKILTKIAEDNDFEILNMKINLDNIHLIISCKPQHYIPNIIKAMKGASGRLLFKEHGEKLKPLLYKDHLWNPNYFISSVNENIDEQIKEYYESQKEK